MHYLCIFLICFCSKIILDRKVFSFCQGKLDYPGSIVYLSSSLGIVWCRALVCHLHNFVARVIDLYLLLSFFFHSLGIVWYHAFACHYYSLHNISVLRFRSLGWIGKHFILVESLSADHKLEFDYFILIRPRL